MSIVAVATINQGQPTHEPSGLRVMDIVCHAYAEGLTAGDGLGHPPIGRQGLSAAVNYCADRACDRDGVHCSGCRLSIEAAGINSLDQWLAQFATVTATDAGLTLTPGGPLPPATVPSLDQLARTWQGEEVYYLARRVHRRMVKEASPRPKQMTEGLECDGPVVLLVHPQMADNIGMVARAMANFGLDELRLVAPRDGWPNEKARASASGANHVIDHASAYPDLRQALSDMHWVCATTARQRHMDKPLLSPEQAAAELMARIERGERCAILFGPERQGLESDDIALADALVMAPVNPRFASLNLAQAVLLLAYEWLKVARRGTLGRVTPKEQELLAGPRPRGGPLATKHEVIGLFEHLEAELDAAGFLKPPEKRASMVRNIRTLIQRMEPSEQEVRTLRGIVAALTYRHRRDRGQP
ncbi:MAG: RNA methyltransferase [Hyphomicrobiaceae bacterium]